MEVLLQQGAIESQVASRGRDLLDGRGGTQEPPHRIAGGEAEEQESEGHDTKDHHGAAHQAEQKASGHGGI